MVNRVHWSNSVIQCNILSKRELVSQLAHFYFLNQILNSTPMVQLLRLVFIVGMFCSSFDNIKAQTADSIPNLNIDSIFISEVSPLPGAGIPATRQPSLSYMVDGDQIKSVPGQFSMDHIERQIGATHFYKASGNDRQPSLNYRGFQTAPLLGLPQGLAVYMDGIRMNDLFGDVVFWEVLPSNGLKSIELIAGSNPIFGLNALGGAVQYQTKTGFDLTENTFSIQGGSYGHKSFDFELGFKEGDWAYIFAGNLFAEDSWREFSESKSGRIFGKVTKQSQKGLSHLSIHYSKSNFLGNGAIPRELLQENRNAVFTHPDRTENELILFSLHHSWFINKNSKLQGLLYFKNRDTQTFNGDDSSYEECEDHEGFLCLESDDDDDGDDEEEEEEDEMEQPVTDQFGNFIEAAESVSSAVNNRTSTIQNSAALVLQYQSKSNFQGLTNRFLAGQRLDAGYSDYNASTELAQLTETRGTIGSGLFDSDQFTEVRVNVFKWSAFASNWLDFNNNSMTLQTAIRANYSTVKLRDQLGTALNGDHKYFHLNPSLGFVWHLEKDRQVFLNYSLSNRTPTPVELTCADPDDPCLLPNSFLADPPLDQVVASTFELGWQGRHPLGHFKLVGFLSKISNDIYFVSAGPARNSGFFRNLTHTSRQGVEMQCNFEFNTWNATMAVNFLNAQFDEQFVLSNPHHPEAIEGETIVNSGSQLPLVPSHTVKFYGEYKVNKNLRFGLLWNHYGQQFIRGDESNTLNYRLPSINYVSLDAKLKLLNNWQIFAEIRNVLNLKYNTFGLLGEPDEIDEFEDFTDPLFLTPAAPRLFRLGVQYSW